MRRVQADDGVWLAMTEEGPVDGPPVLFAHSVGCDFTLWDGQAAALARNWRVIRFDARGHGGSQAPDGDYSPSRLARDALHVLDAAGVGRVHLCGLSLGGTVALWLALNAPERLASMVLCDTAARLGSPEVWQSRMDAVRGEGMAAIADLSMTRFFSDGFLQADPRTVARFRERFVNTRASGYAGCCAALRDADFTLDLARITTPTLVIGGLYDIPTPPRDAEHLAATIPGAVLVLLEAGHLSNIEAPDAFNAALLRHLDAHRAAV